MSFLIRLAPALALVFAAGAARAQSVAFTFDDGPRLAATPRLSPEQRNLIASRSMGRTRGERRRR